VKPVIGCTTLMYYTGISEACDWLHNFNALYG